MFDLAPFERICAIAIGKASVAMASGLAELLSPDFRAEGIVVTPSRSVEAPAGFRAMVGGILCRMKAALQRVARFWIFWQRRTNGRWSFFSCRAEVRR